MVLVYDVGYSAVKVGYFIVERKTMKYGWYGT